MQAIITGAFCGTAPDDFGGRAVAFHRGCLCVKSCIMGNLMRNLLQSFPEAFRRRAPNSFSSSSSIERSDEDVPEWLVRVTVVPRDASCCQRSSSRRLVADIAAGRPQFAIIAWGKALAREGRRDSQNAVLGRQRSTHCELGARETNDVFASAMPCAIGIGGLERSLNGTAVSVACLRQDPSYAPTQKLYPLGLNFRSEAVA